MFERRYHFGHDLRRPISWRRYPQPMPTVLVLPSICSSPRIYSYTLGPPHEDTACQAGIGFASAAVAISIAHRWPRLHETTGYRGQETNRLKLRCLWRRFGGEKILQVARVERDSSEGARLDSVINGADAWMQVTLTQLDVEVENLVTAVVHSRSWKQNVSHTARCRWCTFNRMAPGSRVSMTWEKVNTLLTHSADSLQARNVSESPGGGWQWRSDAAKTSTCACSTNWFFFFTCRTYQRDQWLLWCFSFVLFQFSRQSVPPLLCTISSVWT